MGDDKHAGFTLIEMSIVLVIIGLIVGGVLVGQDLIKAASLRAQVSQFEKYNTAVNTFYGKYQAIPGDFAYATQFYPSLSSDTWPWQVNSPSPNGTGNGNGDGLITDDPNNPTPWGLTTEPLLFWLHLSMAGLADCCAALNSNGLTVGVNFPQSKLGSSGIVATSMNGKNGYFWGLIGLHINDNLIPLFNPDGTVGVLTPAQAKAFDSKIDDGFPTTGNVYTTWIWGGDGHVYPYTYYSGYGCNTSTAPYFYDISITKPSCTLFINMQ